ncbi:putative uncharacterized protein C19orf81 homolog isoform X1 [Rattus norvegicus]|uniref:Simlar to human chromosome 19 open reading frame 81 n=1 Tax=Rattus norvegicus TaxID=10116 RepID=A0A8I6G8A3_RAT|eukprot:XP_006229052.1 PREDICTED: putative uncharacterized protein C19orf81 homolog isoform X2 [Rattus norvegicus]
MEKRTREVGERVEIYGRNVEDNCNKASRGRQTENWEDRGQGLFRRDEEKAAMRHKGMGTEVRMQESRKWGAHRVPEVRGRRVSLWSQPSSSAFVPRGVKEQEARVQGKSWGVWPSERTSPHLPGPPPTRLSKMQPEVEPFSSPNPGASSSHRESGTMAVIPSGAHPVARALEVPRNSSKSTVPLTQRPGIRHHRFALFVPFPTSLEAEIACGSLAPDVEPHQGLIGKELKVSGSVLEVHWTSEDSRLLRISIMNFLDQLSLVVNTVQVFGPPFSC